MMKYNQSYLLVFLTIMFASTCFGQSTIIWPETPSAIVFQDFLAAYNTGSKSEVEAFVKTHYSSIDSAKVAEKTEYWLDIYHRYGSVVAHSLSINQPHDLEVWLQGTISHAWFAPEFILNEDDNKIKAVGMLQGMQPTNTSTPAISNEAFLSRLIDYLENNTKHNLFQGTVLISQEGKVIHNKAYGFKNIENRELNTLNTRFDIVSITKSITAIAILQLVQNRQLSLFTTIDNYLPELPKNISSKISIFQLLTHTSDYKLKNIEGFREEIAQTSSLNEVYQIHLKYLPKWDKFVDFEPSENWNYSNQAYDLLGIIVEQVTGLSFEDYLKTHIFDVAEMPNTSFSEIDIASPYRYDLRQGGLANYSTYPSFFGKISAAAQLKSTVEDLMNLFNSLKNSNQLLDDAHKSLLFSALIPRGGDDFQSLGMEINYETILNIGHSGVNVGNTSELFYFPETDLLLIVLCNNRSGAPNLYNFVKNNMPINSNP